LLLVSSKSNNFVWVLKGYVSRKEIMRELQHMDINLNNLLIGTVLWHLSLFWEKEKISLLLITVPCLLMSSLILMG